MSKKKDKDIHQEDILYNPVEVHIPDSETKVPEKFHWSKEEIESLPSHIHGDGVSRDIVPSVSFLNHPHFEEMKPGGTTTIHRHAECWIYIISGRGTSEIQGKKFDWKGGDLIFIPPWCWHRHWNTDPKIPARFLAVCPIKLTKGILGWAICEDRGFKTYNEIKE